MSIRSSGRPQTRWENDVKNDLNIMKICNWKDCMQDRHKWEKKSLRRPKHSIIEVVEPEEEDDMTQINLVEYSGNSGSKLRHCSYCRRLSAGVRNSIPQFSAASETLTASCPIDLLTYLLTPWSRVLPEKLKRPELLKKFPAFCRTRRFITAFTRARHLSLS
jgi:hypothetical protein